DEANGCGVDFSKAVVLKKPEYISTVKPHIRPMEFETLRGQENIIEFRLKQYIKTYKKAKARLDVPRNRNICKYSTLQYFEDCIRWV
ncbi:MAG: hypothetical protein LIO42_07695, partial [Oscillospiraceae bacterium]|nr:hypothetical protein [Oscillospiraceae bacterium]